MTLTLTVHPSPIPQSRWFLRGFAGMTTRPAATSRAIFSGSIPSACATLATFAGTPHVHLRMSESIRTICFDSLLLCMKVRSILDSSVYGNSYIFGNVLVDAGVLPMAVQPYKEEIETIVLTHCHFDHIAHLKEIAHMCKAKVAIHKEDARGLVDDAHSLSMHFGARSPMMVPDITLADGDTIGELRVIHTPGHTPGSICLYSEPDKVLISGDTVFTDGAFGRFDFPGGSRAALTKSLEALAKLEVHGLYPGHGEPVDEGGYRHIAAALQLIKGGYG